MPAKPPFVIHVNEMDKFPGAVYIGRGNGRKRLKGSQWRNPFGVARYGRADAIQLYRSYINQEPFLGGRLSMLTGKPLACWCRHSDEPRTDDNMCHGDVLVELWKEVHGDG